MFGACAVKERPGEVTGTGGAGATSTGTESTSTGKMTTGGGGDATSTSTTTTTSTSGVGGSTGTSMACTGVETMCASGCADLSSDGANCNACGHSCLG